MKWRGVASIVCLGLMAVGAGLIYAQSHMDSMEEGLRMWLLNTSPVMILVGALGISVVGVRMRWFAWIGVVLLLGGLGVSWLLTEEYGASMGTTGWVSGLLYITVAAPLGVGLCVTACIISIVAAQRRDPLARPAMAVTAGICGVLCVAAVWLATWQGGAASLVEELQTAQGEERVDVLWRMTHMRDQDLVASMIPLLEDPDPEVRKVAAMVIQGQPGAVDALDPLFAAIGRETDSEARQFEVRAVGSAAMDAPQRKDEVAGVLIDLLDDPDKDVRIAAADALGWLRHPAALVPLVNLLEDPDSLVVWQAHESLLRITDMRLSDDPEEWRQWLGAH